MSEHRDRAEKKRVGKRVISSSWRSRPLYLAVALVPASKYQEPSAGSLYLLPDFGNPRYSFQMKCSPTRMGRRNNIGGNS